ncbi:hypothetical protein DevBK_03195 [Devosia sp. BK]|uniref:hypothetical protein n=1 Tax=Devosia sp. BK TaxID=2871706 RepID=UPI00293A54F5|nr:hypothetical protein [Devosia sp. BK]MDV3250335.1 hypothetical protein [Devosia sp. BK]
MKLDRRLTNGLAWAGALLVIGVPTADYLTGSFGNSARPSVAVVDAEAEAPVANVAKPAATSTTKPQSVANADPVGGMLQSGKPLPSYITGGDAPASPAKPVAATPAKPAAVAPATQQPSQPAQASTPTATPARPTITTPDQQVAALPAKTAPMPMPLSMRPRPVTVPLASNQPLIIDQPTVPANLPLASLPQAQQTQNDFVTADDLNTWESGPLSDFLANRNRRSTANYTVQQNVPPAPVPAYGYDSNGVWLDQVPQGDRPVGRYEDDVIYLPY